MQEKPPAWACALVSIKRGSRQELIHQPRDQPSKTPVDVRSEKTHSTRVGDSVRCSRIWRQVQRTPALQPKGMNCRRRTVVAASWLKDGLVLRSVMGPKTATLPGPQSAQRTVSRTASKPARLLWLALAGSRQPPISLLVVLLDHLAGSCAMAATWQCRRAAFKQYAAARRSARLACAESVLLDCLEAAKQR